MGFCKHDYKYTQGYHFCVKCGKHVYGNKTHRRKSMKQIGIILGAISLGIIGVFIFQNYATQTTQKEASDVIANTRSAIQQISSQVSKQTTSLLQNNSLTSYTTPVMNPIPYRVFQNSYYIDYTPHDLQITNGSHYKEIQFLINVKAEHIASDDTVWTNHSPVILKDNNLRIYHNNPNECPVDGVLIDGKSSDNADYQLCYDVPLNATSFNIFYQDPSTVNPNQIIKMGGIDLPPVK